jgi:hypothetical protein
MCGRYSVLTEDEIIEVREVLKSVSLIRVFSFHDKTLRHHDGKWIR